MTTKIDRRRNVVDVAGCAVGAEVGGAGPPVVVLDHVIVDRTWHELHDRLAGHATVYGVDLPGFNGAPRPDWARDVRDLVMLTAGYLRSVLDGPATIVGSEFGGWVAAELAVFAPDVVANLVLVGSAGLLPESGKILDMMLISHSGYAQQCFTNPDEYDRFFAGGLTDERLLAWDFNREMVARVAWKPYMYNRRLAPMLSEVEVPAALIWGDDDQVMPRQCADQFAAGLPNATVEIVADSGNAVALERPAAVVDVVRSLLA